MQPGWVMACRSVAAAAVFASHARAVYFQRADDECSCLVWSDAYAKGGVKCGDAHEFYSLTEGERAAVTKAEEIAGEEVCTNFFEKVNENMCFNVGVNSQEDPVVGRQWCYVDARCKHLDGGGQKEDSEEAVKTKFKYCNPDVDRMSRYMSVEEVQNISRANDLDLGFFMRLAYPSWLEDKFLSLSSFWRDGDLDGVLEPEKRERLTNLTSSGVPLVISRVAGQPRPPFYAVSGKRLYSVESWYHPEASHLHPGSYYEAKCVKGCPKPAQSESDD